MPPKGTQVYRTGLFRLNVITVSQPKCINTDGFVQKGDVYSFAIILQQIILRSGPFELPNDPLELSEIEILQEVKLPMLAQSATHNFLSGSLHSTR